MNSLSLQTFWQLVLWLDSIGEQMNDNEFLTKDDLRKLDSIIDSYVPVMDLAEKGTSQVIAKVLHCYETQNSEIAKFANGDTTVAQVLHKQQQDSLHFAAQWVYRYCNSAAITSGSDTEIDGIASRVLDLGVDYSQVWDVMSLLQRDFAKARWIDEKRIEFFEHGKKVGDLDAADLITSSDSNPGAVRDARFNYSEMAKVFADNVHIVPRDNGGAYLIQPHYNYIQQVASLLDHHMSHLWQLDPSWQLNGFTIGQFREFWRVLLAYSFIRTNIYPPVDNIVEVKDKRMWCKSLCGWSDLPYDAVDSILSLLTYDICLYSGNRQHPDVVYQPFFSLNDRDLALSSFLVTQSNAERNLSHLISIVNRDLWSKLSTYKQLIQRSSILKFFDSNSRIQASGSYDYGSGDIDLFLLDEDDKFGLIVELKWLIDPDRIRDVFWTIRDLQKGIEQARRSLNWVKSNTYEFAAKAGINRSLIESIEFEGVVLSKNTLGGGRVWSDDIPIVNEKIMQFVLGKPLGRTLRDFWHVAQQRSYIPINGKHFEDADIEVTFGEVTFQGREMHRELTEIDWDPSIDIVIP